MRTIGPKLAPLACTVVLVAALASCGDDASAPAGTGGDVTLPGPDDSGDDTGDGTVDGAWRAVSATADGRPVELLDGWDVTLNVDGDEIGGRAACNSYGGTARFGQDGTVDVGDISATEMGCERAVMEIEQAYLRMLREANAYTATGDGLTLSAPGAEWVFERLAPVPDAEIVGTTWVLDTYLDGDTASSLPFMDLATLRLDADGTLTGSTSCRRLEGRWVVRGAEILFTSFVAIDDPTAGACAPESEHLDGLIVSVLGDGFTTEVVGDRLTVRSQGDQGLSFVADR